HMVATLGRQRGWSAPSRAQFDIDCSPQGPYLIGDAKAVADKILYINETFGYVDRISLQMTNVMVSHEQMLKSIELLGNEVAPIVRRQT
ncbi:MAG: LLM class flavin-dependent oxidoreductase, partial [Trueperaceae bacterium]|nr:LLM class flavin-dependent oxidoreductase [Trueperaceae bacterium]